MINNLFTVSSDKIFVEELADYLWKKVNGDACALAEYSIILPTNRSIRALKEAFVSQSEGKAALLPRMMTVNSFADEFLPFYVTKDELREIPDFTRQFLIANLIKETDKNMGTAKALSLAESLISVLDDFTDYGIEYKDLENIVPENFAVHWQKVLTFLKIITSNWKEILSEKGFKDKKFSYNRKIDDIITLWKQTPYEKPLVMAGLSYVSPAVKKLFAEILKLPRGEVVFYGLDNSITSEDLEYISETHPQYGFKKLFSDMSLSFTDVKDLTESENSERLSFLKNAMRPAETVHKWKDLYTEDSLKGIYRFDCTDIDNEADTVSVILRAALENEGMTAIVVTKNKDLARMIKGKMKRWHVELDDSTGYSLSKSKTGIFLGLIIKYVLHRHDHSILMELLKHPFCLFGHEFTEALALSRELEMKLREQDHNCTLEEIKKLCAEDKKLSEWVDQISYTLAPLLVISEEKSTVDFKEILSIHSRVAERIAATPDDPYNLWSAKGSFREGTTIAMLLYKIVESSDFIGKIDLKQYAECLDILMRQVTIRPFFGMHPRLDILSPIESRLQRADVVIIAGLNEETWGGEEENNPWLSREMKKKLGLISSDFNIGLTAMDFINMAAAKEVYLTRSVKEGGISTNPSRWLLRLETLLEKQSEKVKFMAYKHGLLRSTNEKSADCIYPKLEDVVASYVKSFYCPMEGMQPLSEPLVQIKTEEGRFDTLSLTELENLWHDPYSVYAKKVLRLKPLDNLRIENGAKEFGTLVHLVLEEHIKHGISYEDMKAFGREQLERCGFTGVFWTKKLERFIDWFAVFDAAERKNTIDSYSEKKGEVRLASFLIKAKADRIDFLKDGEVKIIDYKTSASGKYAENTRKDYAPQIPFEALMLRNGAFGDDGKDKEISSMEFWQFDNKNGGKIACVQNHNNTVKMLLPRYAEQTKNMLDYFSQPDAVYSVKRSDREIFSDYVHLSRYEEWFDNADDDRK